MPIDPESSVGQLQQQLETTRPSHRWGWIVLVLFALVACVLVLIVWGTIHTNQSHIRSLRSSKSRDEKVIGALASGTQALRQQIIAAGKVPVAPPADQTIKNLQGPTGATGNPGPNPPCLAAPSQCVGPVGPSGSTGLPGQTVTGPAGGQGGAGPQGPGGPQGPAGQPGPAGPQGSEPPAFTFPQSNGSTTTCTLNLDGTTYTCITSPPPPPPTIP